MVCTRQSKRKRTSRSSGRIKTLATITFQNYFRMYKKLAGMTGTGQRRSGESEKYTSSKSGDSDQSSHDCKENQDVVYRTEDEKRNAAKEIKESQARGPAGSSGARFRSRSPNVWLPYSRRTASGTRS